MSIFQEKKKKKEEGIINMLHLITLDSMELQDEKKILFITLRKSLKKAFKY